MNVIHWLLKRLCPKPRRPHPGHKPLKKFTFALMGVDRNLTITAVGRRIGHHGGNRTWV